MLGGYMNDLLIAAKEIRDFMAERRWSFCVIGGLAVARWGEARATQDVDLALLTGFGNEPPFVESLLSQFSPRFEDTRDFALAHRVVLLYAANGVPLDITLAALPYEEEMMSRATPYLFAEGLELPTCSAEDLFIMKAFASRPKDWMDAEGIAIRQGRKLDNGYILSMLEQLSDAVSRPEIIQTARQVLEHQSWPG